jgi:transcriptional regulator
MGRNRKLEDRAGVVAGLAASDDPVDHEVAAMIQAS